MAGKKKAGISQNADWSDIPQPNSTEQALRAGAKVRQSLARIIHERSGLCDFPAAVQL